MLMLFALFFVFIQAISFSRFSSSQSRELRNEDTESAISIQDAALNISYYNTTGDPIAFYEGASKNEHEDAILLLTGLGYRITTISIYGKSRNPATLRYAVTWVKRGGPDWTSRHGMTLKKYKKQVELLSNESYVPVQVSATGIRSDARFAAVFEKINASGWFTKGGLIDGDDDTIKCNLEYWNTIARDTDCSLHSLAIYGIGLADRTYVGIWLPNPTGSKWHGQWFANNASNAESSLDISSDVGVVPLVVDSNDGNNYAAAFTDKVYGNVVTLTGLNGNGVRAAFDTYVGQQNLRPINVQGGDSTHDLAFSAIFAEQEQPKPKAWTEVHALGANYTNIHLVIKNWMQLRGIRSAVLNVRKNGTVRLSSAYTWAEITYNITQPNTLFRVASISKAFASAAIFQLNASGFNLDTKVFAYLGINTVALPSQHKDKRIDDVTVLHCLQHTGGWNRDITFDPVFEGRMIARALGLAGRASTMDIARYMYGEPLQNKPGDSTPWTTNGTSPATPQYYSNFGYLLLELTIEKATNMSFYDYLKLTVLTPLGIDTQVFVGQTLIPLPGEGQYGSVGLQLSAYEPWSDVYVPCIRGCWIQENIAAPGGLVSTAEAVTRLINNYSVFRFGPRSPVQSSRTGSLPGTTSRAMTRTDGIDYFQLFNTDQAELPNTGMTITDFNNEVFAAITAAGF